jgi:hypothetical protein
MYMNNRRRLYSLIDYESMRVLFPRDPPRKLSDKG